VTNVVGVDVRVYKCVPDEFGQRVGGQEMGREEPRERGLVAEGA
jgi:hypothetical protein